LSEIFFFFLGKKSTFPPPSPKVVFDILSLTRYGDGGGNGMNFGFSLELVLWFWLSTRCFRTAAGLNGNDPVRFFSPRIKNRQ